MVLFLSILYVLVCFLLVVAVLLQEGKGGGLSSAFGAGGAGQTLFGAGGAGNFLTKATSILGGAFMLFSLLLALLSGSSTTTRQRSVLQPNAAPVTGQQAVPGQVPQAPAGTVLPEGQGTPPAGQIPAGTQAPAETPVPAPGTPDGSGN